MAVISGGNVIEGAQSRGTSPTQEGKGTSGKKWFRAKYKFSEDGGAVGDIPLSTDTLPVGAIVTDGFIDVITPPTSGGAATIALKLQGAADLLAAAAISGAPWSTVGRKAIIPVGTAATGVKVATTAKQLNATVAVAALTAGEFDVYLEYIETVP